VRGALSVPQRPFILVFCAVMILWIVLNTWVLAEQAFDPSPYQVLNLVLPPGTSANASTPYIAWTCVL
jgi:uncharacterized membrane protein